MWCSNYSVGLGIFPILLCVCSSITFLTTYMVAVSYNHVYPWLPTISDTGGKKPEANIFSLFLSISSFLGIIVVFIRYRQFRYIADGMNGLTYSGRFVSLNKTSFIVGLVAVVGAGVVASFQDRGVSLLYHVIGAVAVFGGGVIYCCMQTYITYCMLKLALNTRKMFWYRAILSAVGIISLFSFLILFYFANRDIQNRSDAVNKKDLTRWEPSDPGFELHAVSSLSEWILASTLFLYFLSFTKEFNKMKVGLRVQRQINLSSPFMDSTVSHDSIYA